jgi:hypothetical protein
MGLTLVRAALWQTNARLSPSADKLLTVMASYALDADPEPWYMGGWEPLAAALKLNGKQETNKSKVARYLAELHGASLITRIQSGVRGQGRARYRLWLPDPAPIIADGTHPDCQHCPGVCG